MLIITKLPNAFSACQEKGCTRFADVKVKLGKSAARKLCEPCAHCVKLNHSAGLSPI